MTQLTIEELAQIADDFLRSEYGIELAIPILRNNRLRTVMGRYKSAYEGVPESIEIAGFMFKYASPEVLVDTLKHECVHYALHVKDEPNDDGHPHFEAELARLGVSSTRSCIVGTYVIYTCDKCGRESKARSKRLLSDHQFRVTRCCSAKINIVGERIYNGTEALLI